MSRVFKRVERVRNVREFGTVVALALVIAFFGLTTENFWSYDSLWSILSSSAIAIAVAAGMTAVIVARQIDLSVGAILGVAGYTVGVLLNAGVHPLLALSAAIAIGAALGGVNGAVVAWLRVPAIIATWAQRRSIAALCSSRPPVSWASLSTRTRFRTSSVRSAAIRSPSCP